MAPHEPTSPRRRIVCHDESFENYDDAVLSRDVTSEGDAVGCSEGTTREKEGRLSPTRRGIVGEPARMSSPLALRQLNTTLRPVVAPSRAAFM